VFRIALDQRDATGCVGVVTDAKLSAIGWYEKLGFIRLVVREGALHGDGDPAPMFLGIRTIAAAQETEAE
jgi:hypothetical protein